MAGSWSQEPKDRMDAHKLAEALAQICHRPAETILTRLDSASDTTERIVSVPITLESVLADSAHDGVPLIDFSAEVQSPATEVPSGLVESPTVQTASPRPAAAEPVASSSSQDSLKPASTYRSASLAKRSPQGKNTHLIL